MRIAANLCKLLAAVLFAMVLMPSLGWAWTTKDCPPEPSQTSIVSGENYSGPNCTLSTTGDVDSFKFKANAGDTWTMLAVQGAGYPNPNICLTLYAPDLTSVFSGCTNDFGGVVEVNT